MTDDNSMFHSGSWVEEAQCRYGIKMKLSSDKVQAEKQLHELNYYERTRLQRKFNEGDFKKIAETYNGQEIEF